MSLHTGIVPNRIRPEKSELPVNDIHSGLNKTTVKGVVRPESLIQLCGIVRYASQERISLSIAGGRHAMGGQQFLQNGIVLDMRRLNRVVAFDPNEGTIKVEAGICWPDLFHQLEDLQSDNFYWTFRQKQTGADQLTIGGALSANVHGRGLDFGPFVEEILSFDVINAEGVLITCSREENDDLFQLAIGGYGLFGVVYAVALKLWPRKELCRRVKIVDLEELMPNFYDQIRNGCLYGDFQFAIDSRSEDFLKKGVFACYEPAGSRISCQSSQKSLAPEDWKRLLYLAHVDKSRGFEEYARFYLSTNGQKYHSDCHQLSHYPEHYHAELDQKLSSKCPGSEMITEIYFPRESLVNGMEQVRNRARKDGWNVIYGTIRLIKADPETFLPWAREDWACVVFNLCVEHSEPGLDQARQAFRGLIDVAIDHGGSYYLTYHKWATVLQLERCYPRIRTFFQRKRELDPEDIFRSNWYDHYSRLL